MWVKRCNGANVKICQHKQRYVYHLNTCWCPQNSKWQAAFGSQKTVREREDLSTGRATWQHDCREPAFQSKLLLWSMQSITWKSGSHIKHPAHKARVSLHLLPRPLLLSYSALTQNAELFIHPEGKRVRKVSQSPGDYKRERWDTWTPVPAPQSYWEGNNMTYSCIPDLGVLYPCVKRIFMKIQTEEYWGFASFQILEGAKPGLPASSVNA